MSKLKTKYLMLCRLDAEPNWCIVSNPTWNGSWESAALIILGNSFNDYVESKNCGVIYRIIRLADLSEYKLKE